MTQTERCLRRIAATLSAGADWDPEWVRPGTPMVDGRALWTMRVLACTMAALQRWCRDHPRDTEAAALWTALCVTGTTG